jgi:hypothetical protein
MYAIFGVENGALLSTGSTMRALPLACTHSRRTKASQGRYCFLGKDSASYSLTLMNNRTEAGIFRLTKSGSFSWVVPSFATGGVNYGIELIQASNGNFYGRMVKKSKR